MGEHALCKTDTRNAHAHAHERTDKETGILFDRQTDRKTDRQTERQTDRRTDRQTN